MFSNVYMCFWRLSFLYVFVLYINTFSFQPCLDVHGLFFTAVQPGEVHVQ